MEIVLLKRYKPEDYLNLDPYEYLSKEKKESSIVFVLNHREGEKSLPVGVLLAEKQGNEYMIRWLYVDRDYRGRGYGEALVAEVFEQAIKDGCKLVSAYFERQYRRRIVCSGETEFFLAHYFQETDKQYMLAKVSDYENQKQEFFYDPESEALALDSLFGETKPEEYEVEAKEKNA